MRYQNPARSQPRSNSWLSRGVDDLLVIPLFPHYAMSSFESAVERVKEVAAQLDPRSMKLQVQPPFFADPDYIAAMTASAREYLERGYDHLLFSFHGVPERQIRKSDPTGCHCSRIRKTAAKPRARPTPPVTGRNALRPLPRL